MKVAFLQTSRGPGAYFAFVPTQLIRPRSFRPASSIGCSCRSARTS